MRRAAEAVAANSVCSLPHANPGLPGFAPVLSGRSRVNPTSTGGGLGRGWRQTPVFVATPLPVPPPQGGRERRGADLRIANEAPAYALNRRLVRRAGGTV